MNDFENGFSVTERKASRKKIKEYLVRETKVADSCPFCHKAKIKRNRKPETRWLYAIIEDQFAYCKLERYKYYCNPCNTFFLNTVEPRAYKNRDMFSKRFIVKALTLWLRRNANEELDGKDRKPSLNKLASEIGVSRSSLSEWNKCLTNYLPRIVPSLNSAIALCSFVDIDGRRRGFICQLNNSEWIPIAAIDEYTSEWIGNYLQTIDPGNAAGVEEVYYDYIPGLGNCLKEYFFQACIGINLNNLFSRLRQCSYSFTESESDRLLRDLSIKMFPVDKRDYYAVLQIPDCIRAYIRKLPKDEYEQFGDFENIGNDSFITNSFQMVTNKSTDKFRSKIRKMIGDNQPFGTIAVVLLYSNPDYKNLIMEQARIAADKFGKKFEFVIPDDFE